LQFQAEFRAEQSKAEESRAAMAAAYSPHHLLGGAFLSSPCSSSSKVIFPTTNLATIRVPALTNSSVNLSVRAASSKKSNQSTSTSERDGSNGGRSSSSGASSSGASGKGSVAEKSMPGGYQSGGGKGGAQLGKGKKGGAAASSSVSKGVESELDNLAAALPGPKPPAGFILDAEGAVVLVAPAGNRIVTIVRPFALNEYVYG
jgi:hypothetical protein